MLLASQECLKKHEFYFLFFQVCNCHIMNKIFEQNITEQDSILCKIEPKILEIISKYLPLNDVVHLSQTCKELHRKLPFYLKKSGIFTILPSKKVNWPWFEGAAINFSIKEIEISFTFTHIFLFLDKIAFWMQIICSGMVVFETQKYIIRDINGKFQIKKAALKGYKHGDRLRFMAQNMNLMTENSLTCSFQVAVQLENYEYGKPINITQKVKGCLDFKRPHTSIDIEDSYGPPSCQSNIDLLSCTYNYFRNFLGGNTIFRLPSFWVLF